jgi:DNA-binding NarL/FixJ family response regulator
MNRESHGCASVVIVDDDFFRKDLAARLAAHGRLQCIASCSDGESGLERICSLRPALALIDLVLPDMSGIELIARVRKQLPSVKLMAVTGIPDEHLVFEALEAEASGFLDKPLDNKTLFQSIDEVLRGGSPLSERARKLLVEKFRSLRPNRTIMGQLSEREREVAELSGFGLLDEAIAKKLGVSLSTIRTHQKNIHHKLHVHSRAELQIKLFGLDRR